MLLDDIRVAFSLEPADQLVDFNSISVLHVDVSEESYHRAFSMGRHLASELVDDLKVVRRLRSFRDSLEDQIQFLVTEFDSDQSETRGQLVDGALSVLLVVDQHELPLQLEEASRVLADSRS